MYSITRNVRATRSPKLYTTLSIVDKSPITQNLKALLGVDLNISPIAINLKHNRYIETIATTPKKQSQNYLSTQVPNPNSKKNSTHPKHEKYLKPLTSISQNNKQISKHVATKESSPLAWLRIFDEFDIIEQAYEITEQRKHIPQKRYGHKAVRWSYYELARTNNRNKYKHMPLVKRLIKCILQIRQRTSPSPSVVQVISASPADEMDFENIWRHYQAIINSHETNKTQMLLSLDESCIVALLSTMRTLGGYENETSNQRIIQVIEDLLAAGWKFTNRYQFNEYLVALMFEKRYRDVIITFLSLKSNTEIMSKQVIGTTTMNYIISAYCGLGQYQKAKKLFQMISDDNREDGGESLNCPPNITTYNIMFQNEIKQAKPDDKLLDLLIDELADCIKRNLPAGIYSMPGLNSTFNSFLGMACEVEHWGSAQKVLSTMIEMGVPPDKITFTTIFSKSVKLDPTGSQLEKVYKSITNHHGYSNNNNNNNDRTENEKSWAYLDTISYNSFIKHFCTVGKLDIANQVFNDCRAQQQQQQQHNRSSGPNMFTYSVMIHGCVLANSPDLALSTYYDIMKGQDFVYPNDIVLSSILKAHKIADIQEAKRQISLIKIGKLAPHIRPYNILICYYAYSSNLESTMEIYRMIPAGLVEPDVVTFAGLFAGYIRVGKQIQRGVRYSSTTNTVGGGGGGSRDRQATRLGHMSSIVAKSRFQNALLDEKDHPKYVLQRVMEMCIPLTHSVYNAMIGSLSLFHDFESVQTAYSYMTNVANLDPDDRTYALLIFMFLRRSDIESAEKVFEAMRTNRIEPNLAIYNSIIHGFSRVGQVRQALDVYCRMVGHISPQLLVKPHQSITNSSRSQDDGHQKNIELSDNDNVVAGLETAAKMVGKFEIKVKPDNNTFFTLIRAFLHQKQPHVALNLYEEMLELGVVPSTVTTAMLADGLEWCGEAKAADNIMMYRNIRVKRLERESAESNRGLADD